MGLFWAIKIRCAFFGRLTTMEDHYRAALEREAAHQESLRRTAADRKKKFDHFESAVSELESALKRSKFHSVPAIPELKCTVSAPPPAKKCPITASVIGGCGGPAETLFFGEGAAPLRVRRGSSKTASGVQPRPLQESVERLDD